MRTCAAAPDAVCESRSACPDDERSEAEAEDAEAEVGRSGGRRRCCRCDAAPCQWREEARGRRRRRERRRWGGGAMVALPLAFPSSKEEEVFTILIL